MHEFHESRLLNDIVRKRFAQEARKTRARRETIARTMKETLADGQTYVSPPPCPRT